MDDNRAFIIVIVAIALVVVWIRVVSAIENVKIAKYESFSPTTELGEIHHIPVQPIFDGARYDLHNYTEWLDEKGALREGFKRELLAQEYILADDDQ